MADLFGVDKSGISRHLKNIFKEKELVEEVVVAKIAIPTQHETFYLRAAYRGVGISALKTDVFTPFCVWFATARKLMKEYYLKKMKSACRLKL